VNTPPSLSVASDVPTIPAQSPHGPLVERLAEEMASCWRAGEQRGAESYFAEHPHLLDDADAALELIAEEMNLRWEAGQEPQAEEFVARFPQWRRQVLALLACHRLLIDRPPPESFPEVGDRLGGFRVLARLGRGAHGSVFLAAQPMLADRPVVLKLGPRSGDEHLSLSRLQHTHIVPLYSVHDFPQRGLRGLCLPYFGGSTLADLLHAMRAVPSPRRTGADILRALEATPPRAGALPTGGPACRFLARASYVEAICWLGACLADALHYAHEHGLLHLDVKPSNVLLAADGQPMLLDFHLARPPLAAGMDVMPGRLGGTPGYMPDEQFMAMRSGRTATAIDGRADVHALGVLLIEALGGDGPLSVDIAFANLRKANPEVSRGLADILGRCVAPEPARRYPTAADLAMDLRRHIANLPLRGVANRSSVERWRKWRRRRPLLLPLLVVALGVAAGGAWFGLHAVRQAGAAETALHEGESRLAAGRHAEAADAFRYGTELAAHVPFCDDLRRRLDEGAGRAERSQLAADLHALCERLRPLYGYDRAPRGASEIESRTRALWSQREAIRRALGSGDSTSEARLRNDLLDLAILYAHLHVRWAPAEQQVTARGEAIAILAEAEMLFGPSCVLCQERQTHAMALGKTDMARAAARQGAALTPRGAWEAYALGRALFTAGQLTEAAELLDRAVALEPGAVWPNFVRGLVAYQAGAYSDALIFFTTCSAVAPDAAGCIYNRGLAFRQLGQLDHAQEDFARAAKLDPSFAE
jgi:serine/threonine protein kinase